MNRFLRETWELFYWAMFCPSKLQLRINFRFLAQYFLLLLVFSLPILINMAVNSQNVNLLHILLVLLAGYGASFWCFTLTISLFIRLIWFIVYLQLIWFIVYLEQPEIFLNGLNKAQEIIAPLPRLFIPSIPVSVDTAIVFFYLSLLLLLGCPASFSFFIRIK